MVNTGSEWKSGFLFVGNQLALDFLNTRPVQDGKSLELLPDFAALLRWFDAAGLLSTTEAARLESRWGGKEEADHAVESARKLREALREQVLTWESGGKVQQRTIEALNVLMEKYPLPSRLSRGHAGVRLHHHFSPKEPNQLLGPLAESAAELFSKADRKRVRKCARCILHFLDTSKKGTRRWCSMNLCGNREKVAAYAARQREQHA